MNLTVVPAPIPGFLPLGERPVPLIEPLWISPHQTRGRFSHLCDATRELMAAVLLQAALDLRKYGRDAYPDALRKKNDVLRWMRSSDSAWPFSFRNLCRALDLDPEYIRAGLEKLVA